MIVAKALANHNRKHRNALSGQLAQAQASLSSAQSNLDSVTRALAAESDAKRALAADLAATSEALAIAKKRAASLATSSDNTAAQLAVMNHELEMMQQRVRTRDGTR
jgi:septal ring factor EnvC (AmiA/AmiB activator)